MMGSVDIITPHITDGHHRVAIHAAMGKDMNAKVIDLQTDRGSCSVRKARCDLGDLAAGDIFQLHLSLKLKSPGRNTLRVHFTSDTLDPYLPNNTLSATTVVYRRR